ncbi:PIG-L deacetylase family protein [Chenggangzhangella methanolivorans]|uniref:PIG-L family deacetylase n=1 Tax=Chenggangzhangella methanolivorans TaxID=1437009 RepID=A0A9E6REH3_9HYPH|nr:PIG-L family deacetylase [Chenggangzhangella methanolivorans]QZO01989.1 PIG-L family deacetylase [Chenggangzhangella methanolivorans]
MTSGVSAQPLSRSQWATARWLVLAPHADDETIGAGALIATAARRGRLAGVAFVTDGAGSHPHADGRSRAMLVALRRREAERAMRRLAPAAPAVTFLDWPDAAPPAEGEPAFERALSRLSAHCRRERVDAVAVTALHEPHCDHEAACRLAYALQKRAFLPLAVFEYLVWADGPPDGSYRALRTGVAPTGPRRLALAAHRSQTTPLEGEGFRLPTRHFKSPPFDLLYVRSAAHGG